ncbi:MAG: GOLPH3/VPS74 family protein [Oscillospiraceae bacterium]
MRDYGITREYALCVLDSKPSAGRLKRTENAVCLVASAIMELQSSGAVGLDEKGKLTIVGELPQDKYYLSGIYEDIELSRAKKPKNYVKDIILSFSVKKRNQLIQAVVDSLLEEGALVEQTRDILIFEKRELVPPESAVLPVIERIRAEFLENGELDDDTTVLAILLQESGLLKKYFSPREEDQLKSRVKELRENSASPLVRGIISDIHAMVAAVAASSAAH